MESKKTFSYDAVNYNPDADGMINNMDYGGLDLYSCVMEIKDNSDDKNASNNNVYMLANDKDSKKLSQLITSDNGPGMTNEKLARSIVLGARDGSHLSDDIGKFGMGLNNATMALGEKIVIIAKTEDGTSRGLYMDLAHMRRENTFKPTLICEDAAIFKPLIARDSIYDAFMAQPSGVLISVTSIKMNIEDIEVEAKKLQAALSLAYKTNKSCTQIYTAPDSEPLSVNEVDVFYKNTPANLDYQAETTVRVFLDDDKKTVKGVFEVLRNKRIKGKKKNGETTYYDGTIKPLYFKLSLKTTTTGSGKIKYEHVHEQVYELPKGEFRDINVNFVQIKEDTYEAENDDSKFDGVPHRRRGNWFYRNTRSVGKCIELGSSLDDYSNRMRMEVTYPPDLDYHMGMRVQKQMGTITSSAINDALIVIWEQQNKELIRRRKREIKEQKKAEQSEDDDYDEDELLANFFPTEAPAAPIKAKKPIVAPPQEDEYEEEEVEELAPTQADTQPVVVEEEEDEFSDDEAPINTIIEPVQTAPQLVESVPQVVSEPPESSKSKVAGHERITSKSEKEFLEICQTLFNVMRTKLPEKTDGAGIVVASEYTELWKDANRLINYFSQ
jgi:hypothetical protein